MSKNSFLYFLYTSVIVSSSLIFGVIGFSTVEKRDLCASLPDSKRIENEFFEFTAKTGLNFLQNSNHLFSKSNTEKLEVWAVENQKVRSINVGVPVKVFKKVLVDKDNTKWFLTDAGIVSFNGNKWSLHNKNSELKSLYLYGFALETNDKGEELWTATNGGVAVVKLPFEAEEQIPVFTRENAAIKSDTIVAVAAGNGPICWLGSNRGISAIKADKWLTPSYEDQYPDGIFEFFPILSMATDNDGDTLYVGTKGAGVARVFNNDVDGITSASVYAQWGPILLPSDTIYSICIQPNNVKWFGTDMGVARHTGQNTMDNWTVFTINDGLINNFVQAIAVDNDGKIWFGTQGGISVFDGENWKSYSKNDGLISNNVLCITVDKSNIVWIGTDNGVSSLDGSEFVNYQ